MGLDFRNLDEDLRTLMVSEIESDVSDSTLYLSSYFNERGVELWLGMLMESAKTGNDLTLAAAIHHNRCLKTQITRNTKNGTIWVAVPHNAAETIAESNFSRFYIRALCLLAASRDVTHLVGYRAKKVDVPRQGSQEKIGALFHALETLADVRETMSSAPKYGMPPGPNSGILAELPRL